MMGTWCRRMTWGASGALLLAPITAAAHPFHGASLGFASGFLHPLGGLDHILAMLAVGFWAGRIGGGWQWRMPALFLTAAGIAFLLPALLAVQPPIDMETGIAVSLLFLGGLIALDVRTHPVAGAALVTLFGMFHGFAHGVEAAGVPPLLFMAGFLSATALLHAGGLLLSRVPMGERLARIGGAGIAATGLMLLTMPA